MQEEINHKTITVYIKGAKVTANSLKAALRAVLRAREKHKQNVQRQEAAYQEDDVAVNRGKQSLRDLQTEGSELSNTALSYAEIKALATGNPYIKEKMDLDIQVAKLRMLRASHTSQIYRLETDIARTYPAQITSVRQRIANLEADKAVAASVLALDKEQFEMKVSGVVYTERKDAGNALIKACTAARTVSQELPVGEYHGFRLFVSYDTFGNDFELAVRGQGKYVIKLGADPSGNITRINNVLESLSGSLEDAKRKLGTLEQQLETAKEEVAKPFPQEQELIQKEARLSELNALLNMDERGSEAALIDDEAAQDVTESRAAVEEQPEESVEADEPETEEPEPFAARSRRYQMAI